MPETNAKGMAKEFAVGIAMSTLVNVGATTVATEEEVVDFEIEHGHDRSDCCFLLFGVKFLAWQQGMLSDVDFIGISHIEQGCDTQVLTDLAGTLADNRTSDATSATQILISRLPTDIDNDCSVRARSNDS